MDKFGMFIMNGSKTKVSEVTPKTTKGVYV